jgi:aspartyl-tRNA(Asn)/glutamyl-tRNA(Gln) amidotransferase subunit B
MRMSLKVNKFITPVLRQKLKEQPQPADNLRVKIGLEIHARILSMTKIFTDSNSSSHNGSLVNTPINSNVSTFDIALPGTMPTLNRRCVEASLITALALNCKINAVSSFERKHYFYPDMPSGYQITQQKNPIALDGLFTYPIYDPKTAKVYTKQTRIRRIQLEHDSARSLQLENLSLSRTGSGEEEKIPANAILVDLNRAGLGLMEIVTEPDFETAFECYSFTRELAFLLRSIETCDASGGSIGEGSFRVDVNVSVHKVDAQGNTLPGVRVELKNLGNFNTLLKATEYEIKRQKPLVLEDKDVELETRTYNS